MDTTLNIIGGVLIAAGLVGAIVPMLPGIPMIFGGIWLIAAVDHYQGGSDDRYARGADIYEITANL